MNPSLSIIVPVLNEGDSIAGLISELRTLARDQPMSTEIIVVDGGSQDGSTDEALGADQVLQCDPGRAAQMNFGAGHAHGDVLLFLHADTTLPGKALSYLRQWFETGGQWGAFRVAVTGCSRLLPLVSAGINLRSGVTGIVTGDQAMFITRELFEREGGFAAIPLMEDVELSRRLRQKCRPFLVNQPVHTSGRRWESHGVLRTVFFMWRLRIEYALGADPVRLVRRYYPEQSALTGSGSNGSSSTSRADR